MNAAEWGLSVSQGGQIQEDFCQRRADGLNQPSSPALFEPGRNFVGKGRRLAEYRDERRAIHRGKKKKSGPQTISPDARINKRISARISASLQEIAAAAESASKCLFCLFTVVSCSPAPDTVSKHQKTKGNIVHNVRGKEKQEDLSVLHCNKESFQMRQCEAMFG